MGKIGELRSKKSYEIRKVFAIEYLAAQAVLDCLRVLPTLELRASAYDLAGLWLQHELDWMRKHGRDIRKKT